MLAYTTVLCEKIIRENERTGEFAESQKSVKRRCRRHVKPALVVYIRNTVYGIFAKNELNSTIEFASAMTDFALIITTTAVAHCL